MTIKELEVVLGEYPEHMEVNVLIPGDADLTDVVKVSKEDDGVLVLILE
jgi:hypothetical protein